MELQLYLFVSNLFIKVFKANAWFSYPADQFVIYELVLPGVLF